MKTLPFAPSEDASSTSRGSAPQELIATVLGISVVTLLAGLWFYYRQVTTWRSYDDEGYVMITLSRFFAGHPLYTDVFTQYGPAYYFLQWLAFFPVSHVVTHDAVRMQNIGIAVVLSLTAGIIVFRLTRSAIGAFASQFASVLALRSLCNEPGHPQAICLLLLTTALLAATFLSAESGRRNFILLSFVGICLGLLIGIKINIGIYFGVAAVITLLVFGSGSIVARLGVPLCVMGIVVAVIVAVLGKSFNQEWVRLLAASEFIAIFLAIGAARFVILRGRGTDETFPYVAYIAPTMLGVFIGVAIPAGFILLRGVSLDVLWYGMVSQHIGFAGRFMISPGDLSKIVPVGIAFASVSAMVVVAGFARQSASSAGPPFFSLLLALLRIIAACLCVSDAFLQALPCLFLTLIPRHLGMVPDVASTRREYLPRLLLVSTAILEGLWIFPVAGSQVSMASFLPHILAGVLLADSVIESTEAFVRIASNPASINASGRLKLSLPLLPATLSGVVFLGCFLSYCMLIKRESTLLANSVPLDLPGSRLIYLAPDRVKTLRAVIAYLHDNADTVLMLPGQYSFTFWAGLNPPTGRNATAWPTLFDNLEQEALVTLYKGRARTGRLVGMRCDEVLDMWLPPSRSRDDVTGRPLFRYITEGMQPVAQIDQYIMLTPVIEKNEAGNK